MSDHSAPVRSCHRACGKVGDREPQQTFGLVFLLQAQCCAMAQVRVGRSYGDFYGGIRARDDHVGQLATLAQLAISDRCARASHVEPTRNPIAASNAASVSHRRYDARPSHPSIRPQCRRPPRVGRVSPATRSRLDAGAPHPILRRRRPLTARQRAGCRPRHGPRYSVIPEAAPYRCTGASGGRRMRPATRHGRGGPRH